MDPIIFTPKPSMGISLPSKRERLWLKGLGIFYARQQSTTKTQSQSPFFKRLPLEIRLLIYRHALEGPRIHICQRYKRGKKTSVPRRRLVHARCVCAWDSPMVDYDEPSPRVEPAGSCAPSTWDDSWGIDGLFSLLTTCRAIYNEAIEILYSRNIFEFHCPAILHAFIQCTPERHLQVIQSIDLDWSVLSMTTQWLEALHLISAKLPGLCNLRILLSHRFMWTRWTCMRISEPYVPPNPENQRAIFESLLAIRQPKQYEVWVNWSVEEDDIPHNLEELPFKLVTKFPEDGQIRSQDERIQVILSNPTGL